jgi:CRP-like cAMP-binding protein
MKARDRIIEQLRVIPGLQHQPDRSLAALARLVDEVDVPSGKQLTRQGASAHEVFVVLEGEADVLVDGESIATIGAGEFIGEMAMLEVAPRSATVRARSQMRVLVIGPEAFGTFIDHGGVTSSMAIQLAQRLRRADAAVRTDER